MAVKRDAGRPVGDALYGELRRALADLRDGGADAMARHLVRRDYRRELVALVDGGRRAAYYDPLARRLHLLAVDRDGVADPTDAACRRDVEDPAAWVDARRGDLDWVHPRYRRAVDPSARRAVR